MIVILIPATAITQSFSELKIAMLPHNLDTVQIEVAPGLALPAAAANFVFNRLQWISEGEVGFFETGAPEGWDFNDLCTLAFLLSNEEFSLAQDMVQNLQFPSLLQPSASMVVSNNNHLKARPFRGRLKQSKQKQGLEKNGSVVDRTGAGDTSAEVTFKSAGDFELKMSVQVHSKVRRVVGGENSTSPSSQVQTYLLKLFSSSSI